MFHFSLQNQGLGEKQTEKYNFRTPGGKRQNVRENYRAVLAASSAEGCTACFQVFY